MNDTDVAEAERLRTTLEITHSLLSAVSSTDPVRALVSRIATLCRGAAAVYDADGTVVANTGEAPANLIWQQVVDVSQPNLAFEVGRWHVQTRRVAMQDGVHVIAISSRGPGILEHNGDLLLDTAERLLGAVHGIQYGATQRDRRENEQLLAALHDGMLPAREHRFWSRLTSFSFSAYAPIRAIELSPREVTAATGTHLDELISAARAAYLPLLVMLRRPDTSLPARVSAVVPDSESAQRWLRDLSANYLIGASAPTSALSELPGCVRASETALDIARGRAEATGLSSPLEPVLIDQIDLSTWALAYVPPRELFKRIERTLAPLESVQLRSTLVTFLASDQSIARTAETLFLHANTVRYRLARIEEALGESISSPFVLSNLILALYPAIIGRRSELQEEARDRG
ncbi:MULTISPECIES: helix-turn-helix domain-containing protein [unclassified Leucobacter]|uniref:PucR family transcriptional regulator n=1 Tax=unclassified Leucobacter TaxID=2621730 RepID=UPI001CB75A02|nr:MULTISPECIES: helix-turn-helix domain-containing protein [unclassified Leucobacter]